MNRRSVVLALFLSASTAIAASQCGNAGSPVAERRYTVTHSRITDSRDWHGTTRTTVRRVFHVGEYWYLFCGDVRDETYYSFFVTSADGARWSGRKIGTGGGVTGGKPGSSVLPEHGDEYAWYPSLMEDCSGTCGVLYTKGHFGEDSCELMFALVTPHVAQ